MKMTKLSILLQDYQSLLRTNQINRLKIQTLNKIGNNNRINKDNRTNRIEINNLLT